METKKVKEEKEAEETSVKTSQVKQTRSSHVEQETTTSTRLTRSVTKNLVKEEKEALFDVKKLEEDMKEKSRRSSSRRPEYEFGGPLGVFFFMIALPALVYGFYFICNGNKSSCTFRDYKKVKLPKTWDAYFNEGSLIVVAWIVVQAILYAIPIGRVRI